MRVTPDILLRAYAIGLFPMAEARDDDELFWVDPDHRGVLPLDRFHLSRRLHRTVRSDRFEVRCDSAFTEVVRACAAPSPERPDSWINEQIVSLYSDVHAMGFAHSVEAWQEGKLVGGLYGVSLGGAFFGESMFSRTRDASKVALVHLAARLRLGGYVLLDTQFLTDHLTQFGTEEIPRNAYQEQLADAIPRQGVFVAAPAADRLAGEIDRMAAESRARG